MTRSFKTVGSNNPDQPNGARTMLLFPLRSMKITAEDLLGVLYMYRESSQRQPQAAAASKRPMLTRTNQKLSPTTTTITTPLCQS